MIGDEWAKAGQELGKAGQEIGKATGKGIDAAQTAGGFFGKYLAGPLEQASGMLEDRLRFTRWERRMRLARRAHELLEAQGLSGPTQKVPLNFGIPLIEAASLEEDDGLQDVWAQLLANAANASLNIDMKRAFVSILAEMNALEAQLLELIVNAPPEFVDTGGAIWTGDFPKSYIPPTEDGKWPTPSSEVDLALWNLRRLGCIELAWTWGGTSTRGVIATSLGKAFVRAVTSHQTA